jgi:hypothetical protein
MQLTEYPNNRNEDRHHREEADPSLLRLSPAVARRASAKRMNMQQERRAHRAAKEDALQQYSPFPSRKSLAVVFPRVLGEKGGAVGEDVLEAAAARRARSRRRLPCATPVSCREEHPVGSHRRAAESRQSNRFPPALPSPQSNRFDSNRGPPSAGDGEIRPRGGSSSSRLRRGRGRAEALLGEEAARPGKVGPARRGRRRRASASSSPPQPLPPRRPCGGLLAADGLRVL